jgi:DNA invertase Pin-like site-specific DNA recombinase
LNENVAAIYCRLSKEDLDKDIGRPESESIKNQRSMLEAYAREHRWSIYDFYIDEDFSGSDRERPAFNRLITDSLLGRFGIVLCKKQARFARDIEYVEKYVHGLFSERQIRFVAVLDNIDTGSVSRSARKASQINSLVDEWYLSDLSESIIAALDTKRRNGEFIGSWAPYGYRKDPKNKSRLVIDPNAAAIIRDIFLRYCEGNGIARIAADLNASLTPNPLLTKQQRGEKIDPNPGHRTANRYLWTPSTISAILHNRTYIGDLVQGKFKKANYKSKKLLRIPERDWIIIPGCHERIIDEETWKTVQMRLSSRSRFSDKALPRPLTGFVFCSECGARLISAGGQSGSRRVSYLCCSRHRLLKESCPGARIEARRLEAIILEQFLDIQSLHQDIKASVAQNQILPHFDSLFKSSEELPKWFADLFIESISVGRRKSDNTQEVTINWSF